MDPEAIINKPIALEAMYYFSSFAQKLIYFVRNISFMKCIFLLLFFPLCLQAQIDNSSECSRAILFATSYGAQFPAGDLAKRFGWNSNIGVNTWIKTSKNLIYGLEGNFLFGSIVNEPNVMGYSVTSNNDIIGNSGQPVEYILNQRGFAARFQLGKIFKTFVKPNPNSGFFIMGGIGYLEHKIYIDVDQNNAAYFSADYLTGFDKKTSGVMLSGMLGYMYLSNSRGFNIYVGLETIAAFTKNVRAWDFILNQKLAEKRNDIFIGPKLGIMVVIYKRGNKEVFYYK